MEYFIKAVVFFEYTQIEWLNIVFNFISTLASVCIGAWFSMRITQKQFKDNNKFIVFTDSKNQIRVLFDEIQNIVNQEVDLLKKINQFITNSVDQYPTEKTKNQIEELFDSLINLNNRLIEKNNHLFSQHRLLSKYFGSDDIVIKDLEDGTIANVSRISNSLIETYNQLKKYYDSYKVDCDYNRFKHHISSISNRFEKSEDIVQLFNANVSSIDDYLNEFIIKLLK